MFKAHLVLACGQVLLASRTEEGVPLGKGTEQVITFCDLKDWAELLCLENQVWL